MEATRYGKGHAVSETKYSLLRTLAIITIAYTLIFTAYISIEVLQSSLNFEDGLGTTSVGVLYAVFAASALGPGPALINKLTPKWALMCVWFSHTLYICANFYPTWATLIPAAVILGFMGPIAWVTQGYYFSTITKKYSLLTHQNNQVVMGKFSSVLDQVDSISLLVGSGISAGILHSEVHGHGSEHYTNTNTSIVVNETQFTGEACHLNSSCNPESSEGAGDTSVCGPNHCPYLDEHTAVLARPNQTLVYILMGTLLGCNLLGILLTCFLKNIKQEERLSQCEKFLQPIKLFKNKRLYLAIWIFASGTFARGIYFAAYQQSFTSCTLGVGMVPYMAMAVAVTRSLAGITSGQLTRFVPKVYHYALGCLINISLAITWIFWYPESDQLWLFSLIAILQGTAHGVTKMHVRSLIVEVFYEQPKAGFAQLCIWESLSSCLAFGLNNVLCLIPKALAVIGLVAAACVSYISLEVILHYAKKAAAKEVEREFETEQRERFLFAGNHTTHSPREATRLEETEDKETES